MQSIRANGEHYLSYSLAESPSGELRYQSRGAGAKFCLVLLTAVMAGDHYRSGRQMGAWIIICVAACNSCNFPTVMLNTI